MKDTSWLITTIIATLAGLGIALSWFLDGNLNSWDKLEPAIAILALIFSLVSVIYSFIVARRRKKEGGDE